MDTLFIKILNMSINASWLVLAVVLLRLLLHKVPKFIRVIMWVLVGVRLICSISIESAFGLIPSAEPISLEPSSPNPFINYDRLTVMELDISSTATQIVESNIDSTPNSIPITVAGIWVVGMLVLALCTAISYFRICKKVKEAIPYEKNIYLCDHIPTPFILGIISPKIFLPSSIDEEYIEYVIAHENAHLERCDHHLKLIGFLLLILHWFNPVIWLAYVLFCRDIELACDEKVINDIGIEKKKAYSNALINCSASRKMLSVCPLAFGEVGVKARIKNVLNYKKPALYLSVTAVITCVAVAVCFLTNSDGIKINQIEECGGFDYIFNNVSSLKIVKHGYSFKLEDRNATLKNLKKIRLEPTPISRSLANGRDKTYQIALNESNTLCFNDSLNEMWIDTITKPSYSHIVKNPEVVQEIFANSTSYSNLYFDDWVSNHTLNITGNSIGFQLGVENSRYAQLQTECSNGYMSGISTISKEKERGVEIVTNAGTPVCWHPDDNSKAGTEINFNVYKNDCIVNSGTISIKYKDETNLEENENSSSIPTYEIKLLNRYNLYLQRGTDEYEGVIFLTDYPSAFEKNYIDINPLI